MGREKGKKREINHQSPENPRDPLSIRACPSALPKAAAGWEWNSFQLSVQEKRLEMFWRREKIRQWRKKRFLQRGRGDIWLSGTGRSKGNEVG